MKPVVQYKKCTFVSVGQSAVLFGVTGHPRPEVEVTGVTLTSTVVAYHPQSGRIETLNTIYEPETPLPASS